MLVLITYDVNTADAAGGRGRKSSCLPEEPLILSRCERTAAIHCLGGSHRNRTPFLRNYQDHTGVIQYHLRKWTQLSLMLQMRKYIFVHTCCRSPHGERGLKLLCANHCSPTPPVAPHTGSVD